MLTANDTDTSEELDLFTMVVLRRRFEAIIREMVNALFKSGRSGVLNTAMDFSCSLTDADFRSVSVALGLPVHVGAIELIPMAVKEKFGEAIRPGDCFVNNSAYHGNTHCGDFTLCVPVFMDDELVFYCIARAHFGDMGFPTPTTYGPDCRDVYQEGLKLPCLRIQRDYQDVTEVTDICRANIRSPEQFYGDYLACLAAVRTGEKRLKELCGKYGRDVVLGFLRKYQDYAETMCVEAIRKLPASSISRTVRYDSMLADYLDGIPLTAKLTIEPDAGEIHVDLTDNVDNLPLGINMSESTVLATCRMNVLGQLGSDIPRCAGSFKRVKVKMREGSAIGKPKFPAATSSATTHLCHLLGSHIQALFAELIDGTGSAYGTIGLPGSSSVVSGDDFRYDGRRFVNQVIMGYWGGPALARHDGWLTYGSVSSQGILWQSSVEVVEQQQPILVEALSIREDGGGAGRHQGAPGAYCVFASRDNPVTFSLGAAARQFPPLGVRGGEAGAATQVSMRRKDGSEIELPSTGDVVIQPGEALVSHGPGGGGYGSPLERDPARVLRDYREGWISRSRLEETYGVVLTGQDGIDTVDAPATAARRKEMGAA
ncbi:hydantoinase B/oxoprolinase family protein [Pseudaminobacter arsenicus]|uniref:Hydantoinase B/oxoprolinase family protein n=1 Tax=Borborobacter arsenicus TaxID=1851146 RepID=A0A432V3E8_9HYPH|nr:hydantoinase B/oxoprolinase family protein [Pseudaminobacter arsenicus]RUM96620.1 hydantoinase B/oxoprolinase family protein [Pseudaminobacter arsenicus]